MIKFIMKEIKPTKRHKCQSVDKCQELAINCLKITGEKKIYFCGKHTAQFFKDAANSYLEQGE